MEEGRLDLLIHKFVPGITSEPGVVLYFCCAVESKAVDGFALDKFIDEIGSL